jgi:hypothetical protein
MDIPVSRLNNRMALQLPRELPLGLVFVVGTVQQSSDAEGEQTSFYLTDDSFRLRCRLSPRASKETQVQEGNRIRAGGHLAFDARAAEYYLLARDVEIVETAERVGSSPRTPLAPILADITKRAKAAAMAPAALPAWVKEMAPPEMQAQLAEATAAFEEPQTGDWPQTEPETVPETAEETAAADPLTLESGLNNELISYLSAAMDKDEEVELTPDLLAELAPQIKPDKSRLHVAQPYDITEPEPGRIHWAVAVTILLILLLALLFMTYLIFTGGIGLI